MIEDVEKPSIFGPSIELFLFDAEDLEEEDSSEDSRGRALRKSKSKSKKNKKGAGLPMLISGAVFIVVWCFCCCYKVIKKA